MKISDEFKQATEQLETAIRQREAVTLKAVSQTISEMLDEDENHKKLAPGIMLAVLVIDQAIAKLELDTSTKEEDNDEF